MRGRDKKTDVTWVPVNALAFDPEVQRALIQARVKYLVREFEPDALGVLTVSLRADGRHYVVDGQHRVVAAREAGYGEMKVKCHVYRDLAQAEEAELFLVLNDARSVSAIDKYYVGLVAGDSTCVGVRQLLDSFGLAVTKSGADGTVGCVDRLLKLYERDPAVLEQTLSLITESWGTRYTGLEQLIIGGLGQVVARYNGEMDRGVMARKLSKYRGGPAGLIGDARALADIRPITQTRALAEIVVDSYNKQRTRGVLSPL